MLLEGIVSESAHRSLQDFAGSIRQRVEQFRGGAQASDDELLLLPAEAVNSDGLFIDSMPLSDLTAALAPATVATGYEITECLKGL